MGSRKLLHFGFKRRDRAMAELAGWSDNTELQQMIRLLHCVTTEARELPTYDGLSAVGWISEQIQKCSTRTTVVRCNKVGTAWNTHTMVGYPSRKFWGLAWMEKDDVPMVWKTPATKAIQSTGAEQLARPPFSVGTDICCKTCTSTYWPQNNELKQSAVVGEVTRTTSSPLWSPR